MKSDFNRGREETMNISFPSSYSTCSANTPSNSDEKCHRKVSNDGEASRTTDLLTNRCGTKRRSSAVISEQSNVTRSKAKRIHEVEAVYSNFSLSLLSAREKRPFVNHSYSDHYHDPPVDDADLGSIVAHSKSRLEQRPSTAVSSIIEPQQTHRPSRGGVTVAFPEKLHEMLQTVFDAGLDHVVSWQPHGRCFLIRQKEMFVEHVMSRYVYSRLLASDAFLPRIYYC